MPDVNGTDDFASLSLRDLLEARDIYHFHLSNKANVVGTAVGRYLIRKQEPRPGEGKPKARRGVRTFENSEVRDYSWPCVLVLVNDWVDEHEFGGAKAQRHPYDMVPNALYMPDGRRVPVCVVAVEPKPATAPVVPRWTWPKSLLGPGFPVLVDHQGQERIASIGCLVSDGHSLYALTSRHVCGTAGTELYTLTRGQRSRIGITSSKQLTRLPFEECYPDFPSRRTFVNLDVGLCEIDEASRWTSRVYGLPAIGATTELNEANVRLSLISANVRAYGAASGELSGRIAGLFYRYASAAGFDYVSDFLIAPSAGFGTLPGDSGTVWHLVPEKGDEPLRPLAVQWGGQAFAATDASQRRFALATSLSSICKQLNVDVVREDDPGVKPFWGQTGHYDIASFACDKVKSTNLRKLMRANRDRISFPKDALSAKGITAALKDAKATDDFIPLADVPDIVWKKLPWKVTGGRDTHPSDHGSTGPEHPTHFADIDEPSPGNGKTLRKLCVDDEANISVDAWQKYYTSLNHKTSTSRGLLPFRVWQHFKTMVDALNDKDVPRFVAAAGTLSHYIGDACQPLHGSMFANGLPGDVGKGIHGAYESKMVDRFSDEVLAGIAKVLPQLPDDLDAVKDGKDAARATILLMDRAAKLIPPKKLIQTYVDNDGTPSGKVAALEALWDVWGKKTIKTMADGSRVLAFLWDAAWKAGNGNSLPASKLVGVSFDTLFNLYTADETFVPSLDLDHIEGEL